MPEVGDGASASVPSAEQPSPDPEALELALERSRLVGYVRTGSPQRIGGNQGGESWKEGRQRPAAVTQLTTAPGPTPLLAPVPGEQSATEHPWADTDPRFDTPHP